MEDTDRKHVITHVSALNVTSTLDDVLKPRKYDRRLRPGFKRNFFFQIRFKLLGFYLKMVLTYHVEMHAFIILDTPVVIYTDILLRSMGPISEKDMVSRLNENSEICAKCKITSYLRNR